MKVDVVMAWARRHEAVALELDEGSTLADAIDAAGWVGREGVSGYAIFGINAKTSTPLVDGDRVEVLRALQVDPMEARRRRAKRPAR